MQMLEHKRKENKYICVGLDTNFEDIPEKVSDFLRKEDVKLNCGGTGPLIKAFNRRIIAATKDVAGAYKYNLGFYLANGLQGHWALQESIGVSREMAPDVPVILDGKFGDVGLSSSQYARFAFEVLGVDAVTVNPYGGREDGLDAFLEYKDKGIFVWCRGSNGGAKDFQDLEIVNISFDALYDEPVYEFVAETVSVWNANKNCGVVTGATYPDQLGRIRQVVGDMPMLIPGIGAQKGDLKKTVKAAIYTNPKTGEKSLPAIFNSSRGIIYASSGEDFAEAVRKKARSPNRKILKTLEEARA